MGRNALELFTKQADGRMPRSPLYDIVRGQLGLKRDLDITYIINHDLNQSRKKMAELQLLVVQAMAAGDPNARALYRLAAEEICLMARTVRRRLDLEEEVRVLYAGGVFQNNTLLSLAGAWQPVQPSKTDVHTRPGCADPGGQAMPAEKYPAGVPGELTEKTGFVLSDSGRRMDFTTSIAHGSFLRMLPLLQKARPNLCKSTRFVLFERNPSPGLTILRWHCYNQRTMNLSIADNNAW